MLTPRLTQGHPEPRRGVRSRHAFGAIAVALGLFGVACSARGPAPALQAGPVPAAVAPTPAPLAPAAQAQPQTDPVLDLLALSTRHFETGQRELLEGHLDSAKTEFNRSLEVLLESTYGARTESRIREHFDRLVERISAYEVTALAQGDGFTEQKTEPATIDDLLAISTFEQPPATPETKQAVSDDLKETVHDIDIPLNAKVLQYVQMFSGRAKAYLQEGLNRGVQYLPMIQSVFRAEGLPLDLAYIPLIESAFKPTALSRAKAKGVWQFMSATAAENGLKRDWFIDERSDPEKATIAAAKYLKTLYRMFDDWHLAMASYNGGPGRLQRAVKRSGRGEFWALSSTTKFLPRETREYVPMILAAVIIAKNPLKYGFDVTPAPVRALETVSVARAVDQIGRASCRERVEITVCG